MRKLGLTRRDIADLIIAQAIKRFKGDKRDGDPHPITVQNFHEESYRLGAKALRARLRRLSFQALVEEGVKALDYAEGQQEQLQQHIALGERYQREEALQALRERQAELGRKHALQPTILAAAHHYRGLAMNAKQAWHAIKREPYQTSHGETVMIEDDKMQVRSRARTQRRSPIKFAQWQKRYWVAAKRISS
jgi:hypothetical protein